MGLDSIELVLAVEEEFGIDIDDADAANLFTPRLLANYIVSKLGVTHANDSRCLSQSAFYRIRSELIRRYGVSRKEVHPESRFDSWIKKDVRRQWHALTAAVGATQTPSLECRKSLFYPISFGLPLLATILLSLQGIPLWAIILSALFMWIVALIVTDKIADIIPPPVSNVAGLVPYVQVPHPENLSPEYVLQKVIQITSAQLGFRIEEIQPDHHFVKDLGVD